MIEEKSKLVMSKENAETRMGMFDTPFKLAYETILAGGAVRDYFMGRPVQADYDLYFLSQSSYAHQAAMLEKNGFSCRSSSSELLKTFRKGDVEVQCNLVPWEEEVGPRFYKDPWDLMDHFPWTICQFALFRNMFYTTTDSLIGLSRRELQLHSSHRANYTLEKIPKYIQRGFTPTDNSMQGLVKAMIEGDYWDESEDEYATHGLSL